MPRVKPDGGYVNPSKLPKGPNGRACCRLCGTEVPEGRRSFCGDECVGRWKLDHQPALQRQAIFDRDRGRCAACGVETEELARQWFHARHPRGSAPWKGYPVADEPVPGWELHRAIRLGGEEAAAHKAAWAEFHAKLHAWRERWRALEEAEHREAKALGFKSASGHLWEMDHVMEVARGFDDGRFNAGNLQTLCRPCHQKKTRAFAAERAKLRKAGMGPDGKPRPPHQWTVTVTRPPGSQWTVCGRCGVILRTDGRNRNNPCRGPATTLLRGTG